MDKKEIEKLHNSPLTFWNSMDAQGMASLFAEDGNVIGFDGSQMNGKVEQRVSWEQFFKAIKRPVTVGKQRKSDFCKKARRC